MKIVLDENLPHELRHHLTGQDVFTVGYMVTIVTKRCQDGGRGDRRAYVV